MTRNQIVLCTILAFFCSLPFPDPLTDLIYSICCALVVFVTLILLRKSSMMQDAKRGLQRLVAGLVTATVVLLAAVLQLIMLLVSMKND